MITLRGFILRTISRVTTTGERVPVTWMAPITTSAKPITLRRLWGVLTMVTMWRQFSSTRRKGARSLSKM